MLALDFLEHLRRGFELVVLHRDEGVVIELFGRGIRDFLLVVAAAGGKHQHREGRKNAEQTVSVRSTDQRHSRMESLMNVAVKAWPGPAGRDAAAIYRAGPRRLKRSGVS